MRLSSQRANLRESDPAMKGPTSMEPGMKYREWKWDNKLNVEKSGTRRTSAGSITIRRKGRKEHGTGLRGTGNAKIELCALLSPKAGGYW